MQKMVQTMRMNRLHSHLLKVQTRCQRKKMTLPLMKMKRSSEEQLGVKETPLKVEKVADADVNCSNDYDDKMQVMTKVVITTTHARHDRCYIHKRRHRHFPSPTMYLLASHNNYTQPTNRPTSPTYPISILVQYDSIGGINSMCFVLYAKC